MTQTVTVPGVGDLDFPDGMSQQDMANAIKQNFPDIHKPQEKPNAYREFLQKGSTMAERVSGGPVVDVLARAGVSPKIAAGAGVAVDVLKEFPGAITGGGLGGALGETAGKGTARFLMQSALKPLKEARESGRAAKAIDTLLNRGINVSEGGVEKLRGLVDDLNKEVKQRIAGSNLSVSKKKVVDTLNDLTDRLKKQVTPQADLNAVKKAWNDFWNHPDLKGRATIPVQKAQELKQGTYRELRGKYGEEKAASIESQKALARGLKEQIEKAHPEIGPLNKQEAELINALDLTEQRVLAEMNKNPGGLTWLTHNPKAAIAFMADRSGPFKSLMARLINRASKPTGELLGGSAAAGQQALSAPPTN